MAAPLGNRFWEARSRHGCKPRFSAPEQLWEGCLDYFQWCEDNPLWESKVASCKGEPQVVTLPKLRAMTIGGLCLFLDIDVTTWAEYRGKEDFSQVVTRAEQTIREQKFAGAAADLLNANIIARDLGLADRKEMTGVDGGPIEIKGIDVAFIKPGKD